MKRWVIVAVSLLVLASLGWVLLKTQSQNNESVTMEAQKPDEQQSEEATEAPESTPKLIIGMETAPITIVEYGDFQCPICKRFFEQTEPQLIEEYIDTGKAKLEFRVETHIGQGSVLAGEATYCANDQARFKDYHDKLFREQGSTDFTAENLKGFAGELGLDQPVFDDCMDSRKYRSTVAASNEEAGKRINGTPTFFIGDQKISGAQPIGVFRAVLNAQ